MYVRSSWAVVVAGGLYMFLVHVEIDQACKVQNRFCGLAQFTPVMVGCFCCYLRGIQPAR